jgi:hypothetical protein
MGPQEVILEYLSDRWSFEGGDLVGVDREGGHTRAATVYGSFPVRVEFRDDDIPDVFASDEAQLRQQLEALGSLESFSQRFSPRPSGTARG